MKKPWIWLLAALALFAVAAWLMSTDKRAGGAKPRHDRRDFPHYLRPAEQERAVRRRTAPSPPPPADPAAAPPDAARDPLLAALPSEAAGARSSILVFEARVIQETPVGELLLDCMRSEGDLSRMRDELGFDPLEDVDRVAVSDEVTLVSGDFDGVKWDQALPELQGRPYGEASMIYEDPGDTGRSAVGVYAGELIVLGAPPAIEAALDRIEGGAPAGEPPIREDETYGEIYGVIAPDTLARLVNDGDSDLAARIRTAADRIELHVDATDDVLIVADVDGPDAERVGDLGRSLGGTLSLGRLKAKAEGDADLAELLDLARVSQHDGPFSVEVALPLDLLEEKLAACRKDGGPR